MHQKKAALSSSIPSPTYVHLGMSLWHHQLFPLYWLISTHTLLCYNFSHNKKKTLSCGPHVPLQLPVSHFSVLLYNTTPQKNCQLLLTDISLFPL